LPIAARGLRHRLRGKWGNTKPLVLSPSKDEARSYFDKLSMSGTFLIGVPPSPNQFPAQTLTCMEGDNRFPIGEQRFGHLM
jgi:hypothetical protein